MSKRLELTGNRYGRLTVLSFHGVSRSSKSLWRCQCECGGTAVVLGYNLQRGGTKSCGCWEGKKHGLYGTETYWCWADMRKRCNNPNDSGYADYGGRGIKVCPRWKDFSAFYEDMGERPEGMTLDRIDNDGDYEPENCRWATRCQQNNNARSNVRIEYNGEHKTLSQWAREVGLKYPTLYSRLMLYGWPIEKALTTPVAG